MERKLSAILAADVVGFSRQMEANEARSLSALRHMRADIVEPLVAEHNGRVVKLIGDGTIIEFGSVVEAIGCAVAIQTYIEGDLDRTPDSERMVLRIGVHLGDVVVDGDDLMGDGVNIAARLEQLCPPGGVLISGEAFDQLPGKIDATVEYAGVRSLKNISRPIRIYAARSGGKPLLPARAPRRAGSWTLVSAVLVAIAMLGILSWAGVLPNPFELFNSAPAEQPSLAVVPFKNTGGDPAQDYFSDGITDEILIALARSPILRVAGRNSSATYREGAIDPEEIGRRLNARYIVTGSVAKAANRVRITARLTDVRSGADLWAETFDRPMSDIFAVQDEIAGVIAARLDARIESAEASSIKGKDAQELGAYEKVLQARALRYADASREATLRGRQLLLEAIDRDPASALAHAELGYNYYREIARRWDPAGKDEAIDKGVAAAGRALELDPSLSFASVTMGNLLGRRRDYASAENFMRRAIELSPNDPESYAGLANVLLFANRAEEALPAIEQARALDPLYPPLYDNYLGRALFMTRQFDHAIPVLRECIRRLPDSWPCHGYLAAALHYSGDAESARKYFDLMSALTPFGSIEEYEEMNESLPGPQIDLLMNALRDLEQSSEK